MKIVVIGGTGLIGSTLVTKLRERGQEVVAASPNTGVNSLTGGGLAEAMKGASVVVDVSNAPSLGRLRGDEFLPDGQPAISFPMKRQRAWDITLHSLSSGLSVYWRAVTSAQKSLRKI